MQVSLRGRDRLVPEELLREQQVAGFAPERRARNAAACSSARIAWSCTSRRYSPSCSPIAGASLRRPRISFERACSALELDHLAGQLIDPTRDGRAPRRTPRPRSRRCRSQGEQRPAPIDRRRGRRSRRRSPSGRAARDRAAPRAAAAPVPNSGASAWRTVMTNCGPTKISISPNNTVFRLVHVPSGTQDNEERFSRTAPGLQALVRLDSILDSELVQGDFFCHRRELLSPWPG